MTQTTSSDKETALAAFVRITSSLKLSATDGEVGKALGWTVDRTRSALMLSADAGVLTYWEFPARDPREVVFRRKL
jgi:hypothetical protein